MPKCVAPKKTRARGDNTEYMTNPAKHGFVVEQLLKCARPWVACMLFGTVEERGNLEPSGACGFSPCTAANLIQDVVNSMKALLPANIDVWTGLWHPPHKRGIIDAVLACPILITEIMRQGDTSERARNHLELVCSQVTSRKRRDENAQSLTAVEAARLMLDWFSCPGFQVQYPFSDIALVKVSAIEDEPGFLLGTLNTDASLDATYRFRFHPRNQTWKCSRPNGNFAMPMIAASFANFKKL
jgi:hypothetical protein